MYEEIAVFWQFMIEKHIAPYGKICLWQASGLNEANAIRDWQAMCGVDGYIFSISSTIGEAANFVANSP